MFSSEINANVISNSQSTPSLSGYLAAPIGWRSEIVHSNSPIVTDNLNNYDGYNITNAYNTSRMPSAFRNVNTGYTNASVNNNLFYRRPPLLTEQQQRNIVHTVERQYPPPLVVRKTLPNNQVTYQQNVSVRYLQPPSPPPPGPLIIREVRPPQQIQPPIKIRQRPAPPPTPPPIVLRERPPSAPPRINAEIVEKILPPPRPASPNVIVERYGECPPKPQDVIVERWLPYKQPGPRRVLVERAPEYDIPPKEPNLLVLYDSPNAHIQRNFINEGVVRVDPHSYLHRYETHLDSKTPYTNIVEEATRVIPPPPLSPTYVHHTSYVDEYQRPRSPYITSAWKRTRVVSPIPRSSSYHYGSSYYDAPDYYCNRYSSRYGYDRPYNYCNRPSSRYVYDSYRSYDDYPVYYENYYRTRPSSWNRYYNSYDDYYPTYYDSYRKRIPSWDRYYDPYCQSSSYYPTDTIRVNSDSEFQRVICDLTNGRVPPTVGSY